jgi:iron(III) transport system permease protein
MHGAGAWTVLRRITGPLMLPAIAAATLLIAIRSVQSFEVPLLIGIPAQAHIFTAQIYQALQSSLIPDYSSASAYGTVLVVVLLILIALEQRLTREARRFAVVTGKADLRRPQRLGRARWLPPALYLLILIGYLLPALYLVFASFEKRLGAPLTAASFGWGNYRALFTSSGFSTSVVDTIEVAAVTAVVTVVLSLIAAWVSVRAAHSRAAGLINTAANVPLVIPGVVLGFGMLLFYLYSPIQLFGTIWVIVIAFITLYLPYGMRYLRPAILSISADLEESARVSGASEARVIRRVVLPLVSSSASGTALYVFFNSFRELAVAALLVTSATPLLSTQLLDQMVNGDLNVVSALGTVILAVCLVAGVVAFRLTRMSGGVSRLFG